jgi:hypothetical protein
VVSQPPLKNTTKPVAGQEVCASSESGSEHLGSRSPTDSSNIPGFGPQWQMIRPVEQVAQGIKKEGEPFGFSLLIACMVCSVNFDLPYLQPRGILPYTSR